MFKILKNTLFLFVVTSGFNLNSHAIRKGDKETRKLISSSSIQSTVSLNHETAFCSPQSYNQWIGFMVGRIFIKWPDLKNMGTYEGKLDSFSNDIFDDKNNIFVIDEKKCQEFETLIDEAKANQGNMIVPLYLKVEEIFRGRTNLDNSRSCLKSISEKITFQLLDATFTDFRGPPGGGFEYVSLDQCEYN